MKGLLPLVPLSGLLAVVLAFVLAHLVRRRQEAAEPGPRLLADRLRDAVDIALRFHGRALLVVAGGLALLLGAAHIMAGSGKALIALAVACGAFSSWLAGYLGLQAAPQAARRSLLASRRGTADGFAMAFAGGAVAGLALAGLALVLLGSMLLFMLPPFGPDAPPVSSAVLNAEMQVLAGFVLGAVLVSLLARTGGGIFAGAVAQGADCPGLAELGVERRSMLHPAAVAELTGLNVRGVLGVGADLFAALAAALVGAMAIGAVADGGGIKLVLLPPALAAAAILATLVGMLLVRMQQGRELDTVLDRGLFSATLFLLLAAWVATNLVFSLDPRLISMHDFPLVQSLNVLGALLCGLAAGLTLWLLMRRFPARRAAAGGAAAVGRALLFLLPLVLALYLGNLLSGVYGIAITVLGMVLVAGMQLAIAATGPIAMTAGSIAEAADLPPELRGRTDRLANVGSATASSGLSLAAGLAMLSSLVLVLALQLQLFRPQPGSCPLRMSDGLTLLGLVLGLPLPFVLRLLLGRAQRAAAAPLAMEVRRQLDDNPELQAAARAVQSARNELRELTDEESLLAESAAARVGHTAGLAATVRASFGQLLLPGGIALGVPILLAMLSTAVLGGLLSGLVIAGLLLALLAAAGAIGARAAATGDATDQPSAGSGQHALVQLAVAVALVLAPLLPVGQGGVGRHAPRAPVVVDEAPADEAAQPGHAAPSPAAPLDGAPAAAAPGDAAAAPSAPPGDEATAPGSAAAAAPAEEAPRGAGEPAAR